MYLFIFTLLLFILKIVVVKKWSKCQKIYAVTVGEYNFLVKNQCNIW